MTKYGLLHDYDLMANTESSAQKQACVVCGDNPMRFQWSDYSGEGMCCKCGTPYQLKWGSDAQQQGAKYPYLNLKESFVPIVREYFQETGRWTCLGTMIGNQPGLKEFYDWLYAKHPELKTAESEPQP